MRCVVILCLVSCLLAGTSSARLIQWNAASGHMPWDTAIPEEDRFVVTGAVAFAQLTPSVLEIHDFTVPERIHVGRAQEFGASWALQIDARVDYAVRSYPEFALQSGVADGDREVVLPPNPFNPLTSIRFRVEVAGEVQLDVFDARGRLVQQLLQGRLEAGEHHVRWHGRDQHGRPVSSGSYWVQLRSAGTSSVERLVLAK